MKNVDEAIEIHRNEWFDYLSRPVHVVDATDRNQDINAKYGTTEPTIPVLDEEIFQQFFPGQDRSILDAPPRRRSRGRPFTLDSNESFQAFLFVCRQQDVFKKRNTVKRVPEKATDAFIDLAVDTWYPNAKKRRIRELLRMRRKYI